MASVDAPAGAARFVLSGAANTTFALTVAIIATRAIYMAVLVAMIPEPTEDTWVSLGVTVFVLGLYGWSAVAVRHGDPRGFRRLIYMCLFFASIAIATTVANMNRPAFDLLMELSPALWALVVIVPLAMAALMLVTAFVAYRAKAGLRPPDELAMRY